MSAHRVRWDAEVKSVAQEPLRYYAILICPPEESLLPGALIPVPGPGDHYGRCPYCGETLPASLWKRA